MSTAAGMLDIDIDCMPSDASKKKRLLSQSGVFNCLPDVATVAQPEMPQGLQGSSNHSPGTPYHGEVFHLAATATKMMRSDEYIKSL